MPTAAKIPSAFAYPSGSCSSRPSNGSSGGGRNTRSPSPYADTAVIPATIPPSRWGTVARSTTSSTASMPATYTTLRSAWRMETEERPDHAAEPAIQAVYAASEASTASSSRPSETCLRASSTAAASAQRASVARRHVLGKTPPSAKPTLASTEKPRRAGASAGQARTSELKESESIPRTPRPIAIPAGSRRSRRGRNKHKCRSRLPRRAAPGPEPDQALRLGTGPRRRELRDRGGDHGLLGSNGAGKTTSLKLFIGLIHPDGGSVGGAGQRHRASPEFRTRIGYAPEHDCLPAAVSAAEFLAYMAEVSGLPRTAARLRASDVLRHVGLSRSGTGRWGRTRRG